MPLTILVVGATRGLGLSLASQYATAGHTVYATSRTQTVPSSPPNPHPNIHWIPSIDIASPSAGSALAAKIKLSKTPAPTLDIVIITAGYFATETFQRLDWDAEIKMYTTSAIGPVFIVQALVKAGLIREGKPESKSLGKVILIGSESGSVTLRHEKEGGGNYGHHASKAASNMVGKLLSLDLKEKGIAVASLHPGFMRTEMTKGVGFDKYWDEGGAVTPDEAAESTRSFIEGFDMSKTGEYWAPRGARLVPDPRDPDIIEVHS
jgi:NAD(P)-dependent dehydrogenase (short-subunit alcohol dehydrogenase family)